MSPDTELTKMQRAFCDAYAAKPNATQAAITAGYSKRSASQQGSFLCSHPKVIENLQARKLEAMARLEVSEDMVLQEVAAIAFSNIKRFTRWTPDGELEVIESDKIPDGLASAIESINERVLVTTNKDGSRSYTIKNRKVKLYPKLEALKLLAEYLGLTDSMAPKVTVHLVTGIKREPEAIDITPDPDS